MTSTQSYEQNSHVFFGDPCLLMTSCLNFVYSAQVNKLAAHVSPG